MNDKESGKGPLHGKKIVLLAEYYASGGTRTYLKQLLDLYAASGAEIVLVGLKTAPDCEIAEWLEKYGFEYMCYWNILGKDVTSSSEATPGIWSPYFIRKERKAFRRHLKSEAVDGIVVSAGTPGQFAGAAGAAARGMYILHTYPHGRRQRYLGRWVMRNSLKKVGQLVAVSDFQKREMTRLWRLGQRSSRVIVIRNTAGNPLTELGRPDRVPFVVMTASWLEPYKEPWEWLQVARGVSQEMGSEQVRFVWLGEGSMLSLCREAVENAPNGVHVEFAGPQDDLSEAYSQADVYLQMSSIENMSLSVIEALRYGTPAVCTNVGGLPEIVVDGKTGVLIPVHDPNAAAAAVVSLLKNRELRIGMSSSASRRYQMEFSYDKWSAQMLTVHVRVFVRMHTGEAGPTELSHGKTQL